MRRALYLVSMIMTTIFGGGLGGTVAWTVLMFRDGDPMADDMSIITLVILLFTALWAIMAVSFWDPVVVHVEREKASQPQPRGQGAHVQKKG